jgi:3-methyladenine DNA glycosylase/8-oxoguanine DNA glycosylase
MAAGAPMRKAALRLLSGDSPRRAAVVAGVASVPRFRTEFLRRMHVSPEALRGWRATGRYRLVYGGPFHLDQTLAYLGRDPHNLAERVEGRRYTRYFPAEAGRGAVQVPGNGAGGKGAAVAVTLHLGARFCMIEARRPRSARRALELHERLVRFLGLAQPLAAFYRAAGGHAVMGPLVRRFAGVRIPQLPTLWEALCWAVIGQQINLAFAYRLRNRLIALAHGLPPDGACDPAAERPGAKRPVNSSAPYPFPAPADVLRLSTQDLLGLQFSRQKARYLLGLAAACAGGDLAGVEHGVFEPTAPLAAGDPSLRSGARDWSAIEGLLLAQTGLGPWSAAYAMMRGLGYLDGLPVGDSGLRTALQRAFGLKQPPTVAQQERLMEPFRPYRSLATYYLWKSLASPSTD